MRLVEALSSIGEIPTPWRLTPTVAAYFRSLSAVKPPLDVKKKILADPSAWFDRPELGHLPPGALALLRDTVSLTVIRAGETINAIPPTAAAELDIRLLPGSDPASFLAKLVETVGKSVEIEILLEGRPAPPSPVDTPLFSIIARAAREASPGSEVGPYVSAGSSDSRFFRERGIVAYGFNPFLVNYYDGYTIHGVDERIRARFFASGVALMRRIVRDAATAAP